MTEAMQMTVSSEIEKRIEASRSSNRRGREWAAAGRRSWATAFIEWRAGCKKAGPRARARPVCVGCALLVQQQHGSAESRDVVGDGADFAVVQLAGDLRHLGAVLAHAVAEGDQLAGGVVGMLAGHARVLGGDAGAVGAVAAGAGGQRAG